MKTRKIKARKAEFDYEVQVKDANGQLVHEMRSTKEWTLPRTSKAYDRMAEQLAEATFNCDDENPATHFWSKTFPCGEWRRRRLRLAQDQLRSLGITRPKEEKAK